MYAGLKRSAPRCGCQCTIDAQEQKLPVERHIFEEFSTRNHGTLIQYKGSFEVAEVNVGRLIKFFLDGRLGYAAMV